MRQCKQLQVSEKALMVRKHKKGLWSPEEDQKLTYYVMNHGHLCWSSVPINAGLQRNGKSCRLRWINYLRPGLKRGAFSLQEEETILTLHALLGNKWSQISQHLPGRTDNEIKNYWHSHLKKKKKMRVSAAELPNKVASMESCSSCHLNYGSSSNSSAADMAGIPPVVSLQKISCRSNLPKILFADWISRDEFQQDFDSILMSSDQQLPQLISHVSNNQLTTPTTIEPQQQHNNNNKEIENHQKTSDNSNSTHRHMTIDQIFEFNDGDFNIDDFIYM